MTDTFRALFKEMVDWIDQETYTSRGEDPLVTRARALLAEPVAEGPTDEELSHLLYYQFTTGTGHGERVDEIGFARAVLARWGRPAAALAEPEAPTDEEPDAFAIVQMRLADLAGDQELMLYRWPDGGWSIDHTNPSSSVWLGEVSGEYGSTGRTIEEAVCKLAELLPTPEATND